jgi:hypothetical protein
MFAQFLFDGRDDFVVVLRGQGAGNAKCGDILRSRNNLDHFSSFGLAFGIMPNNSSRPRMFPHPNPDIGLSVLRF